MGPRSVWARMGIVYSSASINRCRSSVTPNWLDQRTIRGLLMKSVFTTLLCATAIVLADAPARAQTDPLKGLSFLEGKWEANTQGGSAGAKAAATYSFERELKDH